MTDRPITTRVPPGSAWLRWIGSILAIAALAGGALLFIVQTRAQAVEDHGAHKENGHPTTELRLGQLEESDRVQTRLLHRIDKKQTLIADRVGVRKSQLRALEEE